MLIILEGVFFLFRKPALCCRVRQVLFWRGQKKMKATAATELAAPVELADGGAASFADQEVEAMAALLAAAKKEGEAQARAPVRRRAESEGSVSSSASSWAHARKRAPPPRKPSSQPSQSSSPPSQSQLHLRTPATGASKGLAIVRGTSLDDDTITASASSNASVSGRTSSESNPASDAPAGGSGKRQQGKSAGTPRAPSSARGERPGSHTRRPSARPAAAAGLSSSSSLAGTARVSHAPPPPAPCSASAAAGSSVNFSGEPSSPGSGAGPARRGLRPSASWAAPARKVLPPGCVIGDFTVVCGLGSGGTSAVVLASYTGPDSRGGGGVGGAGEGGGGGSEGTTVVTAAPAGAGSAGHFGPGSLFAVKVMAKERLERQTQLARLATERRVLSLASDHPNVAALHGAFQTESQLFFVLDFCSGGDLYVVCGVPKAERSPCARSPICDQIQK